MSVFIPIPKKGNAKECSNYHTIALISHDSKVILKILKHKLQQYMNQEHPHVQVGFRKGRGTRIKLPTFVGSWRKQGNFRKTSTSASLIMLKLLTVWITAKWKILKEVGMPDHLTCLLRNLYAGQEATVRTARGTTNWLQAVLSPCLLKLSTEELMLLNYGAGEDS